MPEEKKTERQKLTITQADLPKTIPGTVGRKDWRKLSFRAKAQDGKELSYYASYQALFPLIEVGKTIEADVETSPPRETAAGTFIDHKVVQIYQEGQPVGQKRSGRSQEESPEKRLSIEAQVAFAGIVDLAIAKIPFPEALWDLALEWAEMKLEVNLGLPSPELKKPLNSAPPKAGGSIGVLPEKEKAPKSTEDIAVPMKTLGDLRTAAARAPYYIATTAVLETILGKELKSITDFPAAWAEFKTKWKELNPK